MGTAFMLLVRQTRKTSEDRRQGGAPWMLRHLVWDAKGDGNAGAQPPMAYWKPHRLLSSTPFRVHLGNVG